MSSRGDREAEWAGVSPAHWEKLEKRETADCRQDSVAQLVPPFLETENRRRFGGGRCDDAGVDFESEASVGQTSSGQGDLELRDLMIVGYSSRDRGGVKLNKRGTKLEP